MSINAGIGTSSSPETDALRSWLPGESAAMRGFRAQFALCLAENGPVLLLGEVGVGKARAGWLLHRLGSRADGPFLVLDPAGDLGAQIAAARRGTVLASGWGLEGGVVDVLLGRTGADGPRVLLTAEGEAKEEYCARFGLYRLKLPCLAERAEDLPVLCAHLLADLSAEPPVLTAGALDWIASRAWPGNVRQLRDCVQRAALLGGGRAIDVALLADAGGPATMPVPPQGMAAEAGENFAEALARWLDVMLAGGAACVPELHARVIAAVERPLIERVLALTDGNQSRAAGLLGLNRNTLRKRMSELGIDSGRKGARR
ncbi:helix-turn-helix domain-containing protein [Acidomonas methanolica]|uniref:Transcriptional regulator nitrogen metabolism NtrC n=1 Tax=Acidomonas methanolica NBRC 104435 TaxID=1231351 RepID=A0A023D574_ACIMT|nr:helix-turn-helix domain-containing protein [Acidomonas methanolica]MBU2654293.1 sigma 54-interacting transcriptional regulator [Acidomonas methanolica]TCS29268.1 DNA-binding NtrC family response regulator [Acidomonas methanolica]GAJ28935.1 transcriptional regulator nitrogen metabolism NtrC [Acidomonas methanolica NBRC 104435]GEK99290.1 hypothetical protein AME01nite_17890 [Acidomonas methanolica NBRC 104435]